MPAYDHLLKLSHVFNVMDARGAVGVTERQTCFATLRGLAREVTGGKTCAASMETVENIHSACCAVTNGGACQCSGHGNWCCCMWV